MQLDNATLIANNDDYAILPISMVILSHNRLSELSNNLPRFFSESLFPKEFEIIVVDNNSTDGSREFLLEMKLCCPDLILVLNKENLGVAGGRNSGFVSATREYIVALDDDTWISPHDLRRIPNLFKTHHHAGILAFRVIHPATGEVQNPHGDIPCEVANHHGAGFAFQKLNLSELGGIDEECNYGAEELDFAIRVHAFGLKVLYVPEITVSHNSLPRESREEQRRLERRIYNNVRIYHKYFPWHMATRNSIRYLVPVLKTWIIQFGFNSIGLFLRAAKNGRKAGEKIHRSIPESTIIFYKNKKLRPEFGNVPLWEKLFQKLLRHRMLNRNKERV